MHQHMNDGTAWVHIVICVSKNSVNPNFYFEPFVRKDSEDIETNIYI